MAMAMTSATMTWQQVEIHGPVPCARLYHCSTVVQNRYIYIFGGAPDVKTTVVGDPVLADMHRFDTRMSRCASHLIGSNQPCLVVVGLFGCRDQYLAADRHVG
jgi:hypothetical protein